MKIAYIGSMVNSDLRLFGNPRWMSETAYRINKKEFERIIISSWRKKQTIEHFEDVAVHLFPHQNSFQRLKDYIKCVRHTKPEILHGYGSIVTGYMMIALKILNPKSKVLLTFNDFRTKTKFNLYFLLNLLDGIIVQNDYTLKKLSNLGVSKKKIVLKMNLGVEDALTTPAKKSEKRSLLYFGDARKYRGIEYIIDSAPIILKKFPDIKFNVLVRISESDYLLQLEEISNKFPNFNVYTRGNYPKSFHEFFKKASIIVLPYIEPPICPPTSLIEAMAMQKPILTSPVCGINEIIKDKINGMLAHDIPEFNKKLIELIQDKNLCNKLAKEARKLYLDEYSWEKNIPKLEKLYRSLI